MRCKPRIKWLDSETDWVTQMLSKFVYDMNNKAIKNACLIWVQSGPKDSTVRVLDRVLVDDFAGVVYETDGLSQGRSRYGGLWHHILILECTQVSQGVFNSVQILWFEFSQLSKRQVAVSLRDLCFFHRFSICSDPGKVLELIFYEKISHMKILACYRTAYSSVSICSKLPSTILSEKYPFFLVDFSIFVTIFEL